MNNIIGNVYRTYKNKFFVVLGVTNINQTVKDINVMIKNTCMNPYIYKDKLKALNDFLSEDNIRYLVYDISDMNFMKSNLNVDNIGIMSLKGIKRCNNKCVNRVNKTEFNKWILKNKMLGQIKETIEIYPYKQALSIIENNIKLPKKDQYIKKYESEHLKEETISCECLIIRKCYKTNQVWYIKGISNDRKTVIGYKLRTFKKSELLETFYFLEKSYNNKFSGARHIILKENLPIRDLDFYNNPDKVLKFIM